MPHRREQASYPPRSRATAWPSSPAANRRCPSRLAASLALSTQAATSRCVFLDRRASKVAKLPASNLLQHPPQRLPQWSGRETRQGDGSMITFGRKLAMAVLTLSAVASAHAAPFLTSAPVYIG